MTATLAVLVVTCPCALSLATPASFAAATARLARLGMLVVKPEAIERLAHVDTVVLDKTGTLTEGAPIARIESVKEGFSADRVLAIAAALERASEHPLSAAFVPFAEPDVRAEDVKEITGQGLEGIVNGRTWRIGRPDFAAGMRDASAVHDDSSAHEATRDPGRTEGRTLLGDSDGIVAVIEIRDAVSEGAREAVADLRRQGLQVAIASGDSGPAVMEVARALAIDEFHSRLDFKAKMEFVKAKQAAGHNVLMVGDGINDGPVLAAANVSCALTRGSAVAQSAADLLLLNQSLRALAQGVLVARRARGVVRQNLFWALIYNVTTIPLAAAGFIPPWVAALGMSMSSLAVVLNSARLASGGERLAGRHDPAPAMTTSGAHA